MAFCEIENNSDGKASLRRFLPILEIIMLNTEEDTTVIIKAEVADVIIKAEEEDVINMAIMTD